MPQLTQYQKDYVLKNRGLNPAEYDIDEDFNIIQKDTPADNSSFDSLLQPSVSMEQNGPPKFPVKSTDSPLSTFGKNLLQDIPGALAGGVGMAAGAALAPETGGLSFLIPLLGGLAGSYGEKRLQQAVEPESWQQNVQESSLENPKSAIAGQLSAIPFGGFSPNPINTVKGVGTLGKVLTGAKTTLPEMQNLLNVGGGAAISGGLNAAQQAISTQPFSLTDVLRAAGEGALFNDPKNNPIGRKLFPHVAAQTVHDRLQGGLDQFPQPEATPETEPTANVEPPAQNAPPQDDIQKSLQAFKDAHSELVKTHIDAQTAQLEQQTKDLQSAIQEQQIAHSKENIPIDAGDNTLGQQLASTKNFVESPADLEMRKLEGLKDKYSEKSSIPSSEESPKDLSVSELPKPNLSDVLMDNPRQPFNHKDTTPKPDVRIDNPRYSEPTLDAQTSLQKEILSNEKIPLAANDKWYDVLKDFLKSYGIGVSDNNQLVNNKTGEPVAGKTTIDGNGIASLIETNPLKRGADTHMHEGFHAFVNALRQSERPADRRMIREYDRLTNESPDYQQWKATRDTQGLNSSTEEYQATNEGYQFLNRHLNLQGESPLKAWINDFKTYLKTRFTKYGTAEDYQRLLDYNLTHGRKTFSEIAGGVPTSHASLVVASKLSDESKIPSQQESEKVPDWIRFAHTWPAEPRIGLNEPMDMFHIDQPLKDKSGEIIHSKDSTVSRKTLESFGYNNLPEVQSKNIEKFSDRSSLADPTHETVKNLIGDLASKQLKEVDAQEARRILINKVDLDEMPDIRTYLKNKMFDATDPESWQHVKSIYDKYIAESSVTKSIKELSKPSEKQMEEVKESTSKPEKFITKGFEKPPISSNATKTEFEELSKKDLAKEKTLAKQDWEKVDNTKDPKMLAAEFRDRYGKALEERTNMQQQGYKRTSSEMQLLERRIRGLKLKYETLIDKRGISEPPIHPEGESLYSDESSIPSLNSRANEINNPSEKDITKLDYTTMPLFRSHLDTIRRNQGENGKVAADAIAQFLPTKDEYFGRHIAPILRETKGLSKQDLDMVENVGIKESRDKKDYSSLLTPEQKLLHTAIRKELINRQQDQIDANQAVTDKSSGENIKRLPVIDKFSWPNKINPKVIEILSKHPNSSEANNLENDFLEFNGNTPEAEKALSQIKKSLDSNVKDYTRFNANRIAEESKLPDSWMRNGLLNNLTHFFNRNASDRAWHDIVENNPDRAKVLGVTKDSWGNPVESELQDISKTPEVKDALDRIKGEPYDESESKLKSYNRIATSLMLGPLTNVHIMGSSIVGSLSHLKPLETVGAYKYAITHLSDSYQHILETGYHRKDLTSWSDLLDTNLSSLEKLNSLASNISNISGRNITNTFSKSLLQGMGEWLVKTRTIAAEAGDKDAINFMRRIHPEWSQNKEMTSTDIIKAASTFASLIHGGHDARTLPSWMLKDTAIQPFFSLASWNVSQTNQWLRHVWTPATHGNFTPIIMSTLGAGIGGYIIKEGREALSNKKSPIPSLQEIITSSKGSERNVNNIMYNLMAMGSYAGYAGILSLAGKAVEDMAHKNIPQGAAFPLDEVISNPVNRLSQFITAAMTDENFNYVNSGAKLVTDLARENIQLGRIATSWLANTGILGQNEKYSKQLNEKYSDLRRFKMVEDLPYESQNSAVGNPYNDMETKKFKRTSDVSEAVGELPKLIEKALEKSNGNIEVLKDELGKIKKNSYQTMPSPDSMPQSFIRYMNFLTQTQGAEAASERFSDYLLQNAKNKAKSSMVPSI